jgi:hypothetical protein
MKVEGATREEAVSKLQSMMTATAVASHMKEKHAGEPAIPTAQVHSMIESNLIAV